MRIRTLHRPVVRGAKNPGQEKRALSFIYPVHKHLKSMTTCYILTCNYRQKEERGEEGRRGEGKGEEGKELRRGEKRKGKEKERWKKNACTGLCSNTKLFVTKYHQQSRPELCCVVVAKCTFPHSLDQTA